jgi:hypothetical protein
VSRIVFVILLALNLGALAWAFTRPASTVERLGQVDSGVAPLVLLAERDGAAMQTAATQVAQSAAAPAQAPARCESLGPFGDRDGAQAAISALQQLTERIQVRTTMAKVVRGYWVHVPAHSNRTDALATARQLAAAGVRDYYVVTAGEQENSIALGLFRDQENADKRQKQVAGLGFRARVVERADNREQFWIDYQFRGAQGPDWKALVGSANRLSATTIDCSNDG